MAIPERDVLIKLNVVPTDTLARGDGIEHAGKQQVRVSKENQWRVTTFWDADDNRQ